MTIPVVSNTYSVRLGQAVVKPVACEECGAKYGYVMERSATAAARTLYWIDRKGTKARAEDAARAKLKDALQWGCDVVPCPQCGFANDAMVYEARRRHMHWLHVLGMGVLVAAAIVTIINLASLTIEDEPYFLTYLQTGLVLAIGPALMAVREIVARGLDPNSDRERNKRLAAGRALSEKETAELLAEMEAAHAHADDA